MITHTPGPWQLRCARIFGKANRPVVDVLSFGNPGDHGFEESSANANLITAAPLMLDALEDIYTQMNGLKGRQYEWIRNRCGGAIQKARGEQ